jgi:hypothetical protein
MDPDLQRHLLDLYERYNTAIKAGQLDQALSLRPAALVQELHGQLKTAEDWQGFLDSSRQSIPSGVTVRHAAVSKDGNKAVFHTVAAKSIPPSGSSVHTEMKLEFVKEDGAWKFAQPTFGTDLDKIAVCKNDSFEPIAAYNETTDTSASGPIVRVAFESQYTLIVFRVLDEENCAFLPNREALDKDGIDPERLTPYTIVEIDGRKHKTDSQKIWGDRLRVRNEE